MRCDGRPMYHRSIPACAGEPCPSRPPRRYLRVYPRVCGGTGNIQAALSLIQGLSPRVRGNHASALLKSKPKRSIPACAGEPERKSRKNSGDGVYPRVCGGTIAAKTAIIAASGLSPRVRGNQHRRRAGRALGGSIPACAGEPAAAVGGRGRGEVYPRVCGGTRCCGRGTRARRGLSPRVRGNRLVDQPRPRCHRSIPACAGEPPQALSICPTR